MKAPLALTLSLFLSLGSVSGVVNQMRPPVQSDFGGGGLQSPIYVNGVSGECFVYVNGTITPIGTGSINVKAFGAKGDGVTDDTAAIQAAVIAAAGAGLFFPPGAYIISKQINIVNRLYIWAQPFSATVYLATQNQNGFVIGDGTVATRGGVSSTYIVGLQIAAKPGTPTSSAGAAVLASRANNFVIRDCSFYGFDGSTKRLFNAISIDRGLEWVVERCLFTGFGNNGIRGVGAVTAGDFVVDGRIDFCEFTNIASDAMSFGDYTAAISITKPIVYSCSAYGVKVDCTPAAGVGFNFFINEPDIEVTPATGALGGVYVKQGFSVQVMGGWIGGANGLKVDTTANSVFTNGTQYQISGTAASAIVIAGAACNIECCDIIGDNAVTTVGVALAATATDTSIVGCSIRQWVTAGIQATGSPARCTVSANRYRNNTIDAIGFPGDVNTGAAPTGTTTPTPVAGSGSLTLATAALAWTKASNRVSMDITVTITTNGTGATSIKVPLPAGFNPAAVIGLCGNETAATGKGLSGYFNIDGFAYIFFYDGTYPGADGRVLRVAGEYRV